MSSQMKRALFALQLVVLSFLLLACKSTLQPGGAYAPVDAQGNALVAPDMSLFVVDSAYQLAYQATDTVFTAEKNNRDLLWKVSPNIKHTLDIIRPQAVKANADYLAARAVYLANPTPANLTGLKAILAKVQQLAITAQSALPKQ